MEAPNKRPEDKLIEIATQYADTTYVENNERKIAAKGYVVGYQQALSDKNVEIKELANIVKMLLPGIGSVSPENLKVLEDYVEKFNDK